MKVIYYAVMTSGEGTALFVERSGVLGSSIGPDLSKAWRFCSRPSAVEMVNRRYPDVLTRSLRVLSEPELIGFLLETPLCDIR